jgi:hypothetical protein
LLEDFEGHSKGWLKYLLGSLDWSEAREREREVFSSRNVGSKCLQVSEVTNLAEEAWRVLL